MHPSGWWNEVAPFHITIQLSPPDLFFVMLFNFLGKKKSVKVGSYLRGINKMVDRNY